MATQRAFNKYAEERKKRNVIDHLLGENRETIREQVLTERYTPNSDKNKDISNFLTRENADEEEARIKRLAEISANAKREMEAIGNKGQNTGPISLPKSNVEQVENTNNLKKTQIFGKESYEDFSKQQDEYMAKYNKEPLGKVAKAWGYLMDTPNRIPGINQIMDTAGKTFLGDENYKKHYTPGEYEKSTGNKVLDTGTKFAGNMVGLSLNPGQTLGLNSMLNVTDDLSKGIANKVTKNMTNKAGTRILNNTVRGVVDGATGDAINSIRLGKSSDQVLEDTLTGAVGGGTLFGAGATFKEGRQALAKVGQNALNNFRTRGIDLEVKETPDVNINNTPQLEGARQPLQLEAPKVETPGPKVEGPINTPQLPGPRQPLMLEAPAQQKLNNLRLPNDNMRIKPKNNAVGPLKTESNNLLPSKLGSDIEPINPIKNDTINKYQIPKVITRSSPIKKSTISLEERFNPENKLTNNKEQKVLALSNEYTELKPYIQKEAEGLIQDLNYGIEGHTEYLGDFHREAVPMDQSQSIMRILEENKGTSYSDIRKALIGIKEGDEKVLNSSLGKRIERTIHEMLTEGYLAGTKGLENDIPANKEYIDLFNDVKYVEENKLYPKRQNETVFSGYVDGKEEALKRLPKVKEATPKTEIEAPKVEAPAISKATETPTNSNIDILEWKKQDLKKNVDIKRSEMGTENYNKSVKANAMQLSAEKRKAIQGDSLEPVEGGLTSKELKKVQDRAKSNYVGKKVGTPDGNGTIEANPFGKVKVKLEDGTIKTYTKDQIGELKTTIPATPKVAEAKKVEATKVEEAPKVERTPAEKEYFEMQDKIKNGKKYMSEATYEKEIKNIPEYETSPILKRIDKYQGETYLEARKQGYNHMQSTLFAIGGEGKLTPDQFVERLKYFGDNPTATKYLDPNIKAEAPIKTTPAQEGKIQRMFDKAYNKLNFTDVEVGKTFIDKDNNMIMYWKYQSPRNKSVTYSKTFINGEGEVNSVKVSSLDPDMKQIDTNGFKEIDISHLTKNTKAEAPKIETVPVKPIPTKVEAETPKVEEAPKEIKDLKAWANDRINDLDEKSVRNAYQWNSMDPEGRAKREIKSYQNHFNRLVEELEPLAKTDEQKALLFEKLEAYKEGYLKRKQQVLSATGRTASSMVTGGARFPVEKNNKALDREHKLIGELLEWQDKQLKYIKKSLEETKTPEVRLAEEMTDIRKDIDRVSSTVKSIMKGESHYSKPLITGNLANRLRTLANNGKVEQVQEALKYVEEMQKKKGVQIFAKNNSIWKIGEQAEAIRTENLAKVGKEVETLKEYTGAKIVKNYQADRVQISFDEKPSKEITQELSKNGWKFSRNNGNVWQRKITRNAEYNAEHLIGKNFKELETPAEAKNIPSNTGTKEPTLNVKVEEKKIKPEEERAFTTAEAPAPKKPGIRISKLKTNTWENTEYLQSKEAKQVVADISGEYNIKTNEDTIKNAVEELNRNYNGAVNRISTYGINTAEDTAIAGLVTKDLVEKGDYENLKSWLHGVRAEATNLGQSVQAFKTWKQGTTEGTLLKASREVNKAKEEIFKDNPKLKETIEEETKKVINDLDKVDKDKAGELVEEIEVNTGVKKPKKPSIPNAPGVKTETKAEVKQEQFDLEGGPKEPTWEEINYSLAEVLAKKVDKASKEPIEYAMNKEKELIDNLFKISKEQLPKYEKIPTDKYELVKLALDNKNKYHNVFQQAKKILIEKYGEGSYEVDLLQKWIDKKARPIFFEKNMDKVISDKLKEHGIKMTDLVKKHYSVNSKVRKDLIEELTGKGNLSAEDSNTIANYINRRMKDLTKEAKERVLNNIVKPKGKAKPKQTQVEKILELQNLGAWDNAKVKDLVSEKYGLPSLTTENIKHIVNEMEAIRKMDEGEAKEIAFAKVKAYISQQIPSTAREKISTYQTINMLLNTKTLGRNVKGNIIGGTLETIKDIPGALIDKGVSKITGKREVISPTVETLKTKIGAGTKEFKKTLVDHKEGIDRSPTTGQYDLPRNKSFKKIENPKGIKQRFNNVLATGEDYLRLGLSLGDRPFYAGSYEESMRVQKITNPERSLEEMQKQAHLTAQHDTYQNDSKLAKGFAKMKEGLNHIGVDIIGLGDLAIPYPKTPANMIDKAIDYSPMGGIRGITNLIFNMKKGKISQKEVVDQISRSVTGSSIIGLGVLLASQGVLTGKEDKNSSVANFKKQAGITPYSLKIGDKYHTVDWVQPMAVPLMTGADIYNTLSKQKDSNITNAILEAIKTGSSTTFNQSLLQGVNKLFGGYSQNAGQNIVDGLLETVLQAPSRFVPFSSALKQGAQVFDNTYRDTRDDNPLIAEGKKIGAKIPGISKLLPARVDVMGRDQKTYDSTNVVSRLNDIFQKGGFTNTYSPTKAEKIILEVYEETKNTDLIPKKVAKEFTVDKKTYELSVAEQREMQKQIGQYIQKNLSYRNNYSEEDILEVLKDAKEKAQEDYIRNQYRKKK